MKVAEIGLVIFSLANVAVLVVPWPVSPKLIEGATMIVCVGFSCWPTAKILLAFTDK
jgi:hypothetical protein